MENLQKYLKDTEIEFKKLLNAYHISITSLHFNQEGEVIILSLLKSSQISLLEKVGEMIEGEKKRHRQEGVTAQGSPADVAYYNQALSSLKEKLSNVIKELK